MHLEKKRYPTMGKIKLVFTSLWWDENGFIRLDVSTWVDDNMVDILASDPTTSTPRTILIAALLSGCTPIFTHLS